MELRSLQNDERELHEVAALLTRVFPKAVGGIDEHYLRWLYLDNPCGPAVGFNAWDNQRLAAHYVCLPWAAHLRGERASCLLSLNTATHPDYQGRGLFTKLAKATYQDAAARYDFVYGVANQNSTTGFTHKLGFTLAASVGATIGFRPAWRDTGESIALRFDRSNAFLQWRLKNPTKRYAFRRLAGHRALILAETSLPATHCVTTVDAAGIALPLEERRRGRPFSLVIGLQPPVRCLGFAIPRALRPSPLNFILKDLRREVQSLSAQHVSMDFLDFDSF
jgi:GNAT superfamily N-acetyltransferase